MLAPILAEATRPLGAMACQPLLPAYIKFSNEIFSYKRIGMQQGMQQGYGMPQQGGMMGQMGGMPQQGGMMGGMPQQGGMMQPGMGMQGQGTMYPGMVPSFSFACARSRFAFAD